MTSERPPSRRTKRKGACQRAQGKTQLAWSGVGWHNGKQAIEIAIFKRLEAFKTWFGRSLISGIRQRAERRTLRHHIEGYLSLLSRRNQCLAAADTATTTECAARPCRDASSFNGRANAQPQGCLPQAARFSYGNRTEWMISWWETTSIPVFPPAICFIVCLGPGLGAPRELAASLLP